jgi:hypothetical protein
MLKVAFYMSGNYARVLRHSCEFLPEYELQAFCANDKSYKICKYDKRFSCIGYLFKHFNKLHQSLNGNELIDLFPRINLSRVLVTDKDHYKKYSANYQEKVINTMGIVTYRWLQEASPDFIIFPIIESVDAMLAYQIAKQMGIKTMCYSHGRNLQRSFFSDSCNETLPDFVNKINKCHKDEAKKLLNKSIGDGQLTFYGADINENNLSILEDVKDIHPILRLLNNIRLKIGKERHNQTLRIFTKFKVYFEKFFTAFWKIKYKFIEIIFIKPIKIIPKNYDAFPLHFSPESSINTPAPFYIDQERAIDKILLSRKSSRKLLVKEHPSVMGKRPLIFYLRIKKKPFVEFISGNFNTSKLIKNSNIVYSVTGTVCLEAFLKGKNWYQLGENFLSKWCRQQKEMNKPITPLAFCEDFLKVSDNFFIISPSTGSKYYDILMSKENISTMCKNIKFFIDNS